jgi:hypothetical protein
MWDIIQNQWTLKWFTLMFEKIKKHPLPPPNIPWVEIIMFKHFKLKYSVDHSKKKGFFESSTIRIVFFK